MKSIALITAGGTGSRTHQIVPKQFISVNDKPIIIYTLQQFQNHPEIDSIVVACLEGWENYLEIYAKQYNITKLKKVIIGGETNFDSIYKCLQTASEFAEPEDIVLIHDGNRPLVDAKIISDCIETARNKGNAITSTPALEIEFEKDEEDLNNENLKLLHRQNLIRTQTPHASNFGLALNIFDKAVKEDYKDKGAFCALLLEAGEKIHFVSGNSKNFKITFKEDIDLFKGIISLEGSKK